MENKQQKNKRFITSFVFLFLISFFFMNFVISSFLCGAYRDTPPVNTRKITNVRNQTGKKIIVRNVPFQATLQEIKQLFQAFGELNFVRLPLKMAGTGTHRGFAFVEFLTKKSAKKAMKALCQSTHLFGRRLVLEWANEDEGVEQLRKRTAQYFHLDNSSNKKSKKASADISVEDEELEDAPLEF